MTLLHLSLAHALLAPIAAALAVGLRVVLGDGRPSESLVARLIGAGLCCRWPAASASSRPSSASACRS
jgi:hypothetical protein